MVRFIYKNQCYGLTNHLSIWIDFKKKFPNLKISASKLKDLFFFDIQLLDWLDTAPVTVQTKIYCKSIDGSYPERREVLANNDLTVEKNLRVFSTIKDFSIVLDDFDEASESMRALLTLDFIEVEAPKRPERGRRPGTTAVPPTRDQNVSVPERDISNIRRAGNYTQDFSLLQQPNESKINFYFFNFLIRILINFLLKFV